MELITFFIPLLSAFSDSIIQIPDHLMISKNIKIVKNVAKLRIPGSKGGE